MSASDIRMKWAKATRSDRAWVEFTDLLDAAGRLFKAGIEWLFTAHKSLPAKSFDQLCAESEPSWLQRHLLRTEHAEAAQAGLIWLLMSGEFVAYGIRIAPVVETDPIVLPAGLFAAVADRPDAFDWEKGVITLGDSIIADIRMAEKPAEPVRGRPKKVDLIIAAILVALEKEPNLLKRDAKTVLNAIIPIVENDARFEAVGTPQIASTRRAIVRLRKEQRNQNQPA